HVEGIAHVVNYDLPQAPEDFVHRVGRTGRAGMRGVASTFGTRAERSEIGRIERTIKMTLTRQEVSADLPREEKSAPVAFVPRPPAYGRYRFRPSGRNNAYRSM